MFEGREGELLASATPVNKAMAEKKLSFTPLFNNAHYDAIPHRIDSPVPRAAIASGGADDKAVRSPVSSPETAFVSIVDFFVVGRTAMLRSSLLLCGRAAAAAEPETAMRAAEAGADEALQTPGAPRRDERALDERMVWWRRWKQREKQTGSELSSSLSSTTLLLLRSCFAFVHSPSLCFFLPVSQSSTSNDGSRER